MANRGTAALSESSFPDAQTDWAASPSQMPFTADGGATWRTLVPPLGEVKIEAIAVRTEDNGYGMDEAGNFFFTDDGRSHWETFALELSGSEQLVPSVNGPRAALRFVDDRNGMAVFDLMDRSLWFAVSADGGRSSPLCGINLFTIMCIFPGTADG